MSYLGIDLGGTKVRFAIFDEQGTLLHKETRPLEKRTGPEVAELLTQTTTELLRFGRAPIASTGICVPGIYHDKTGTVWAPNIPGWENYPLLEEMKQVCTDVPVVVDNDRACYILGEAWQGNARGCRHAIYLSVGTGIGAGILVDGVVLRGAHDIAGAIGWMALDRPFMEEYKHCGYFETFASGEGIVRLFKKYLDEDPEYHGSLRNISHIGANDIFTAYDSGDLLATKTLDECVELWGMAAANLISLFNPEKIIFGGGVFGPATRFIPNIRQEAIRWAQPVSMQQVEFESSALDTDAGVYGAVFLARQARHHSHQSPPPN